MTVCVCPVDDTELNTVVAPASFAPADTLTDPVVNRCRTRI